MRRWMLALSVLCTCSTLGCALCDRSLDHTYSAFGGRWPRADRSRGRVGSLFDPAEAHGVGADLLPEESGYAEMEADGLLPLEESGEGESVLRREPADEAAPAPPGGDMRPSDGGDSGLDFQPGPLDDATPGADAAGDSDFSLPPAGEADLPRDEAEAPAEAPAELPGDLLPKKPDPGYEMPGDGAEMDAGGGDDDSPLRVPNDLRPAPKDTQGDSGGVTRNLSDEPSAGEEGAGESLPSFDSVLPKPE